MSMFGDANGDMNDLYDIMVSIQKVFGNAAAMTRILYVLHTFAEWSEDEEDNE